jgi:hypothetical protein
LIPIPEDEILIKPEPKPPKMNKKGIVSIKFNTPMVIPEFIDTGKSDEFAARTNNRRL